MTKAALHKMMQSLDFRGGYQVIASLVYKITRVCISFSNLQRLKHVQHRFSIIVIGRSCPQLIICWSRNSTIYWDQLLSFVIENAVVSRRLHILPAVIKQSA